MDTLSFQAPEKMHKALAAYAREFKLSKAHLLRNALEHYMDDLADIRAFQRARAKHKGEESYTLDAMRKRYGLD